MRKTRLTLQVFFSVALPGPQTKLILILVLFAVHYKGRRITSLPDISLTG